MLEQKSQVAVTMIRVGSNDEMHRADCQHLRRWNMRDVLDSFESVEQAKTEWQANNELNGYDGWEWVVVMDCVGSEK